MAFELVSGADFLCKLMCGAGPVDLGGSPAPGAAQMPKIDDLRSVKKSLKTQVCGDNQTLQAPAPPNPPRWREIGKFHIGGSGDRFRHMGVWL